VGRAAPASPEPRIDLVARLPRSGRERDAILGGALGPPCWALACVAPLIVPANTGPEKASPPFVHSSSLSVVLVEADVHDVVPTGRVVALETLVHPRVLLAGELLRDHREVHHIMARRRLVALHALFGAG
jgi:hypothetical protein